MPLSPKVERSELDTHRLRLSAPRRGPSDRSRGSTPAWGRFGLAIVLLLASVILGHLWPEEPLRALEQALELERAPEIQAP